MITVLEVPQAGQSKVLEGHIDYSPIGNVLLSNTTVCEASRVLGSEPRHYPEEDPKRVCDLMLLIESIVLHDRIVNLPAMLPYDIDSLELRNLLIEKDALATFPMGEGRGLISKSLLASFRTVAEFTRYVEPVSFEDFEAEIAGSDEGNEGGMGAYSVIEGIQTATSFEEAVGSFSQGIGSIVSGDYAASMSMLRAMYYVFASEHYGLPYLASVTAQPVQQRFPNYFQPAVRDKIYEQLGSALRTTVEEVAHEFEDSIVFIPPFSAIVLDRASTPAAIPSEALALRAEYNDFRRKMCDLERDRLEAKSLNDRMKALRQLQRLGTEVARPFNHPSQMKLDAALRYIPDAVNLAANPTNPVQWARLLLSMPTDALVSWYRRRPVAKLVRTAKTVGAMPGYDVLLIKHFGEAVASRTLEIQKQSLKIYQQQERPTSSR